MIRVVLADDHEVVRAGLRALLGLARDIDVVGDAANGRDALHLIERLTPHVAIFDLDMPVMDGSVATKLLIASGSATRVLILTMHDEPHFLVRMLECGAAGYLVKSAADREISDAVRAVASGNTYVQPSAALTLAREVGGRASHRGDRQLYESLTERERDVLVLVASGFSESQIGEKLFISARTVRTYRQRITEKSGLARRSDYIQFCLRLGLLKSVS